MAFTFAGQYTQEMLAAVSGVAAALPLLSVSVYQVGTTTPVTLYTSRTKAAGANPVSTDANSNLTFFVDPGQYDIVFTPPGGSQKRITISVPADPLEASGAYAPINPAGWTQGNATYLPATGSAAVRSMQQPGLLPDPTVALRRFHADLAAREYGDVVVQHWGTSISEGAGVSLQARSIVRRLNTILQARFPSSGVLGGIGYLPSWDVTGGSSSWKPWTSQSNLGGLTESTSFGFGARNIQITDGSTRTYTVTGTAVNLMYVTGGGGTLGYSVDGGAVTNISQVNGSVIDQQSKFISFGGHGTHTITISRVAGAAFFSGILVYDGDESAGVRVIGAAHSGWSAADVINANNALAPTSNGCFERSIAVAPPSLLILEFGANEYAFGGRTVAGFGADLQTLITRANSQAGVSAPSIVLLVTPERSDHPSNVDTWANYVAQMYTVAAANPNVTVCDLGVRLPTVAADTFGLYADTVHPNDVGSALIAEYIAEFVSPS